MAAVNKIPDIVGFNQLKLIVDIINDVERYAHAMKEMGDLRDHANRLVEKVGKAEEIEQLYIEARTKLADAERKAKQMMEEVETQAVGLKQEAQAYAEEMISKADGKMASANDLAAKVNERVRTVEAKVTELTQKEAHLREWESGLQSREASVTKAEAEIAEKKRKLAEII